MPYLFDETQDVARAYGARTTPHVFVLDGELLVRYEGAPDADHDDPSLDAAWMRSALDAVLGGSQPDPAETEPVGCSIKWRRPPDFTGSSPQAHRIATPAHGVRGTMRA